MEEKDDILKGRDIFECANQLGGYVGPDTPEGLAKFLLRESDAAAALAEIIVRQSTAIHDMMAVIMNRLDTHDPKVKSVLIAALQALPTSDFIPE